MAEPITCYIYRSPLKELMYLYLKEKDAFAELPEPLRRRFGEPEFSMELELTADRKLANADARQVIEAVSRYYERDHANVHRGVHTLGRGLPVPEGLAVLRSVAVADSLSRFQTAPASP